MKPKSILSLLISFFALGVLTASGCGEPAPPQTAADPNKKPRNIQIPRADEGAAPATK